MTDSRDRIEHKTYGEKIAAEVAAGAGLEDVGWKLLSLLTEVHKQVWETRREHRTIREMVKETHELLHDLVEQGHLIPKTELKCPHPVRASRDLGVQKGGSPHTVIRLRQCQCGDRYYTIERPWVRKVKRK